MPTCALLMPESYRLAFEYFRDFWTRSGELEWGDWRFVVNPDRGTFDGLVVTQSIDALERPYSLNIPRDRSLLLILEPPDLLFLPGGYSRQFGAALGCDWRWNTRRTVNGLPFGHMWFVEVPIGGFDGVAAWPKSKEISAVVSAKTTTQQHRQRISLLQSLKEHFGDRLDWFGRGIADIGSLKLRGLADYRYHIAIENGSWPGYWTEKLSDAYVANCFPFYCGAPNINRYFDPRSMEVIPLDNPLEAIRLIEGAIADNRWAVAQPLLAIARQKIAAKYHRYGIITAVLNGIPVKPHKEVTIRPHSDFRYSLRDRLLNRIWSAIH